MNKIKEKDKILLVGGEGYIGNVVAQILLYNGYNVISLDNLLYRNQICVPSKAHYKSYQFIYGDMLTVDSMSQLIDLVDVVVLLAGLIGDPITKKYPKLAYFDMIS